jgi:ferric-dicitrate binding protein FerR (iron transport regulator)
VWLKGEAYFEGRTATATQPAGPLVVLAGDVQVLALGARLDVQHRRGKVRVLAGNEARVRVKGGAGAPLRLGPGEAAEVTGPGKTACRLRVKPETCTAWRSHRLVFEETPLREIAHALEDHFGVAVQITTPDLAERRFTGAVSTRDLPALLSGLSGALGVRIDQQPGRIVVQRKP